ncbi:MAG: AEC family transporter [Spirochaetota bacterium]|jgi:predicted permease|nr:AEC family transporter [Spirochaetota bacterium]
MGALFSAVLPVFLIVLAGALCRIFAPSSASWEQGLSQYGMYVAFPALIINSLLKVRGQLAIDGEIYLLNTILLLLLMAIPFIVTRWLKVARPLANTYIICIFFGNIGYLGFPIVTRLLGAEGFSAAALETSLALHISLYNIVLFSVGLLILEFSRKALHTPVTASPAISAAAPSEIPSSASPLRAIAANPLLLSVVAGVIIALCDIPLPDAIEEMIAILSQSATAVVLFGLGIFLPEVRFEKKTLGHVCALSVLGLLVVPLVFMAAQAIFRPEAEFQVSILEGAMPLAVSPFVLATSYPLIRNVIAGAILVSTALSVITVPFILHCIR